MIVLVAFLMAIALPAAVLSDGCGCTVASPDYDCAGLAIAAIPDCTELASDAESL